MSKPQSIAAPPHIGDRVRSAGRHDELVVVGHVDGTRRVVVRDANWSYTDFDESLLFPLTS